MNNQAPPNESSLFNYEEFSARFGTLDQRNFMETSPIRGAHSSPSVSRLMQNSTLVLDSIFLLIPNLSISVANTLSLEALSLHQVAALSNYLPIRPAVLNLNCLRLESEDQF